MDSPSHTPSPSSPDPLPPEYSAKVLIMDLLGKASSGSDGPVRIADEYRDVAHDRLYPNAYRNFQPTNVPRSQ